MTGCKNLDQKELQIKMSLSVQRLVVESFSFNGKNIRAVHVPDVGQCLVAKDVYAAVGYNKENHATTCSRKVQNVVISETL